MKKILAIFLVFVLLLAGCQKAEETPVIEGTKINLSDKEITVDGNAVTTDSSQAVYTANDIVFYLEGQDFTYGEGEKADEHTQEEADAHTVVHISKPGTYVLNGELSKGQIAVDLGEDAETNPEAVVTLVLNDVDITCTVAPAVIFYNVYECGVVDEESATKDVDTSKAGANVLIADGTENNIKGSYVAKIYKSYELNEEGTEIVDSKKLHKYDAAFYSKKTMNVNGGEKGDGILNIKAENEGLDSELHLTINGGNINITSGNDGINTNEDNVSVTTINGGSLNIICDGSTGEGDGIDSNGWLVINGGSVTAQACATSGDAGIDSDKGIYINGGTLCATGNMLDQIAGGDQTYAVFNFAGRQAGNNVYYLRNTDNKVVGEYKPTNDFTYMIIAGDYLAEGDYTFWTGETQLSGVKTQMGNMGGMMPPDMNGELPEGEQPNRGEMPEDFRPPQGERREKPEDFTPPEGMENMIPPEGFDKGDKGQFGGMQNNGEASTTFTIVTGANQFIGLAPATA